MRTYLVLMLLLLLSVSAGVDAQFFPGNYIGAGSSIRSITSAGAVTTIWDNPGTIYGIIMDAKNDKFICSHTSTNGLLSVDPSTGAYTTIIADASIFNSPRGIALDQDGNIVVASLTTSGYGLFKVSGSTITTLTTTLAMGTTGSFSGGLVRDVDTGNWVLQTYDFTNSHPMYSVAPDGSSFTTVHTGIPAGNPGWGFAQDIATGHYYVGGKDGSGFGGYLLQVQKNGTTTITAAVAGDSSAYLVPVADRATAVPSRIVSAYFNTNLYYTDLSSFGVSSVAVGGSFVSPRSGTILHNRNIQTVLTAPEKWDICVSFPSLPNKVYALVATISGIRPGIGIGGGKQILLNPDAITFATLVDAITGVFKDGGNLLDSNGHAMGKLDTTGLPPLGGLALHIVALVETSPGTIAAVSDPYLVRLP